LFSSQISQEIGKLIFWLSEKWYPNNRLNIYHAYSPLALLLLQLLEQTASEKLTYYWEEVSLSHVGDDGHSHNHIYIVINCYDYIVLTWTKLHVG
jgi:hypothetical protein